MIEPKTAFLAGIARFCKEAGYDDADRQVLSNVLFMPAREGSLIVMRAEAARREALVKRAGEGLCKLAASLTEQVPGGHLFQNTLRTMPEGTYGQVQLGRESIYDTSREGLAGLRSVIDKKPPSAGAGAQPGADGGATQASSASGQAAAAVDPNDPRLGTPTEEEERVGVWAAKYTPELSARGFTPDSWEQLQKHVRGRYMTDLALRNAMRGAGLSYRPGPGSSIDWSKVTPGAASSPEMQQLISGAQQTALSRQKDYEAVYGPRAGYATRGSGFGTGAYQPKAMRGGTGATKSQLLTGRAPPAVPGAGSTTTPGAGTAPVPGTAQPGRSMRRPPPPAGTPWSISGGFVGEKPIQRSGTW